MALKVIEAQRAYNMRGRLSPMMVSKILAPIFNPVLGPIGTPLLRRQSFDGLYGLNFIFSYLEHLQQEIRELRDENVE